jgi:predicted metal-dependent hydrolase
MPNHKLLQLELPLERRRDEALPDARIALGNELIGYTVKRSGRRRGSFSISIDESGLRIGVPWQASARWIEDVLRRHERWIVRKLAEWRKRRAPVMHWEDGAVLMFLGEPITLLYSGFTLKPERQDERLLVPTSRRLEAADVVKGWLREQALGCFAQRIAHYASRMDVHPAELRLSNARTRWGSCHRNGKILVNWRLVQMPLPLVDYVVVHELAHLREMNHSPRFWRAVAGVLPDYAARRKALRGEGHRYLRV